MFTHCTVLLNEANGKDPKCITVYSHITTVLYSKITSFASFTYKQVDNGYQYYNYDGGVVEMLFGYSVRL